MDADGVPVPGVPTFVCVLSNVRVGVTLINKILKASPVNVMVTVPEAVAAFEMVTWDALSTDAMTEPAGTPVPDTAIPTARPAVLARPVMVKAVLVVVPEIETTAAKQCAANKASIFQLLQRPVVAMIQSSSVRAFCAGLKVCYFF